MILEPRSKASETGDIRTVFVRMVFIVFLYIAFYSCVYFYLNARISALMLLIGCLVFTPAILIMERRHPNVARACFHISCLFYVYATPFGIRFPLDIDFYYMATLLIPVVLFNSRELGWISFCIILCPLTWSFQKWGPMPEMSSFWLPEVFPEQLFRIINFVGATLITVIFLKNLVDRFQIQNLEKEKTLNELNQFFNVALDALCILEGEYFQKVNPTFCSLLGYTAEELTSKPFYEFLHPSDRMPTIEALKKVEEGDNIKDFRNCYQTKSGDFKIFSWSTSYSAELNILYAAGRDITELVAAENLAEQERAKTIHNSKLASLGEMSAGIAHEINNPLMIISGNVYLIDRNLGNPEKLKLLTSSLRTATERIVKIINGLLKFSHSSEKVEVKECSLHRILDEARILLEGKAKNSKTDIKIEVSSEPRILCNDIEIEQVIINLMGNGIDAVKDLDEKWVLARVFEEKEAVVLQIIDSGRGIDESVSSKMFQPFFTTKDVGEGTGLGLSIVKGILDDHGASIELLKDSPHTSFEIRFKKMA